MIRFASPEFFILFLYIPIFYFTFPGKKFLKGSTIKYSDTSILKRIPRTRAYIKITFLKILRIIAISLFILALSRPQAGESYREITTEGIDIVIALDTSGSMRAEDFKPHNRLYVAKQVTKEFIQGRKNDRIGLVVFAAMAFTQCPLTLDYGILMSFVDMIDFGMIKDGTAIGSAIATAVMRLKNSPGKSKVIILLTDGRNNAGNIDPLTATKIAKKFNIKIYTIGVGRRGMALFPVEDPIFGKRYVRAPVEIDEELLKKIAKETGGKYYRATDAQKLEKIFKEISQMEKTEIKMKEYVQYSELFHYFLIPGLILFFIEQILGRTRFKKLP